jgi:hypothetical protein
MVSVYAATVKFDRASRRDQVFVLLVVALLAAVTLYIRRTTAGLRWPLDIDLYRDIVQATAVRNGHLFGDANYAGETAWYNPLLGWVVAIGSLLTRQSVATFATQGGVYLNLLSPIGLTFLAYRWFGRKVAGLALVCMVFLLCGNWPSWAVTTFSPWLFTANFAQGIFFVTVAFVPDAIDRPTFWRSFGLGALVGALALTHTAPALLVAAVMVATSAWVAVHKRDAAGAIVRAVVTVAAVSIVVSAPFWLPVAIRYRMKVRNPGPSGWVWDEITPHALPRFVVDFIGRWPLVVIALGMVAWVRRRFGRQLGSKLVALMAWTGLSALGFVAATFRASGRAGASLVPNVVPSYHWLLYLSAALCLWFGIAAASIVDWLAARARRPQAGAHLAAIAALAAIVVAVPSWRNRHDLKSDGAGARTMVQSFENFRASTWIRDHTLSTDVVAYAGSDPLGLIIVGLAARHSLVTNELFSNPFVDWGARDAARIGVVEALGRCDVRSLRETVRPYGRVPFLVVSRTTAADPLPTYCPEVASLVFESERVVVYQLPT